MISLRTADANRLAVAPGRRSLKASVHGSWRSCRLIMSLNQRLCGQPKNNKSKFRRVCGRLLEFEFRFKKFSLDVNNDQAQRAEYE
ncbi:hypothetical protein L596_000181 [Steinernema carpocapsae]|uniref:Uncharacterized protein n=1 Tax=Steinernema carpocapsae TaxID=34508 RepID=A0A4U8UJK0_STECR|nr:hypothetical protein L596_000181 [Steinernema carpocapsae]